MLAGIEALKACGAERRAVDTWAHLFVRELNVSLSGGQRQRIALARALVGRLRVLILDEATSALDSITEQRVQRSFQRLRTTRIVVAHRLSTIRRADRIYVLDRGRIVDAGTHDELAARPGVYRQLIAAQLESEPMEALHVGTHR
jgi:ABC-type bacteriocin/lantibiotic exporter with double-glycine peptidase domain